MVGVVVLLLAGGAAYYFQRQAAQKAAEVAAVRTETVSTGDIFSTVSATGGIALATVFSAAVYPLCIVP